MPATLCLVVGLWAALRALPAAGAERDGPDGSDGPDGREQLRRVVRQRILPALQGALELLHLPPALREQLSRRGELFG